MTLSFQERLARLAETEINTERIRFIERCFGSDNKEALAIPGRALVGEGILVKECRKKPKQRYFFLFNDILVYGTSVINKKKYINQHIISLADLQIKPIIDSPNSKLKNGWLIMSPKKSFGVYATTAKEKIEWMTHISNCIEKLSTSITQQRNNSTGSLKIAPKWVPDKQADMCMRCNNVKFNVVNRRHHCRKCGYVVCGDCSKHKLIIQSQSDEPLRVCNRCFITKDDSNSEFNDATSTATADVDDNEQNNWESSDNDSDDEDYDEQTTDPHANFVTL